MKYILLLLLTATVQNTFCQRPTPIDYINKYGITAVQEMERSGVPAAITLAQGILESESGNSELALKSNNHFGIKCKETWEGEKVYHNDDARGECFRKYTTIEQSYADHSNFLKINNRYAFLFELDRTDYIAWAKGLKKAGYATNPQYAQKLIDLIEKYNLNEYTKGENIRYIKTETITVPNDSTMNPIQTNSIAVPNNIVEQQDLSKIYYINQTKAVRALAGTSLLAIANKYNLTLDRLLEFNDLNSTTDDILTNNNLIFIQRKRKQGAVPTHTVKATETLYDIAQMEGIRLEVLLTLNNLRYNQKPTVGTVLTLTK